MATIIKKNCDDIQSKNYILIGAGKNPSSYGKTEEPYLIVCDNEGNIEILSNFTKKVRAIQVDGELPAKILAHA